MPLRKDEKDEMRAIKNREGKKNYRGRRQQTRATWAKPENSILCRLPFLLESNLVVYSLWRAADVRGA